MIPIILTETIDDVAARLGKDIEEIDPDTCEAIVVSGAELIEMSGDELNQVLM